MSAVISTYKTVFLVDDSEAAAFFITDLLTDWAGACYTCLLRNTQHETLQAVLLDNLYILLSVVA